MHFSIPILTLFLTLAHGQTYQECTADLVRTDDCAGVIDANACYNKFRWNAQTLTCIEGKDDAEKKRRVGYFDAFYFGALGLTDLLKACKCCNCVGKVMCDWVSKQKYTC
jgi:hypothetical protein